MRYMCLVYLDNHAFDGMSEADQKQFTRDSLAYDRELEKGGHLVMASALAPVTSATTVKVRQGKVSTTDGPFAETKEFLGGFLLIEARDLNQALNLAAGVPVGKVGKVEVRPLWDISESL